MSLRTLLSLLALSAAALLAGCGGENRGTVQTGLSAPRTAQVDGWLCSTARPPAPGPMGYRAEGQDCLRSSALLDDPAPAVGERRRALLTEVGDQPYSRLATADELFNWAELTYATFFPSRRESLRFDPYTYRYYPETRNHVGVTADGKIYIQGPVSGGGLAFVGTLAEFTCRVNPALCDGSAASCAPISQWEVGSNLCTANPGQAPSIADGVLYSFIDSVGATSGVATFRCTRGTLVAVGAATCEQAAQPACNARSLKWVVGANECTPNANEPTQIESGNSYTFADSTRTTGRATFTCNAGVFSAPTNATCNAPVPINCETPSTVSWQEGTNRCVATSGVPSVADGSSFEFLDTEHDPFTGQAVFACNAGTLELTGTPVCRSGGRLQDSFGADGGPADGSANGDGTAADGAPIVGGTVRVTDLNGRSVTTTTDTRGYWRVKLTGLTPPFVVHTTRPDGVIRRSLNLLTPKVNGYVYTSVTGMTDKLVSDLAKSAGFTSPAALTPSLLNSLGPTVVAQKVDALRRDPVVREQLVAAGLNPDAFDPVTAPFRPNGVGYDAVLDRLVFTTDSTGATVIREASCTYSQQASWTVNGKTCSTGVTTALALTATPGTSVTFSDNEGAEQGSATYTCKAGQLVGPITATCETLTNGCTVSAYTAWCTGQDCSTPPLEMCVPDVQVGGGFIANGASVTWTDSIGPVTGFITETCTGGQMGQTGFACNNSVSAVTSAPGPLRLPEGRARSVR